MTTPDDLTTILTANGAVGDWENRSESGIERWWFPRFIGADDIGTCDKHDGEHKRNKKCEDFTADTGNLYMSRAGLGPYDSDVETLVGWAGAPRNVVGAIELRGEPGGGKTALVEAAATHAQTNGMCNGLRTHICTPDDTRDSLFFRFVGENKGDCINDGHPTGEDGQCEGGCRRGPYTLGPIPYACKWGLWLYLDEWRLLVDGVKPVLYGLADGRRFLAGGNIDGSDMEIDPAFRLFLSSNPDVRGASITEPMGSRTAGTTITVETSPEMLLDLGIDEAIVQAWEALGRDNLFRPAIREMRVADYWLRVDPAQAVSAFLPEHCPESDRAQVRDIVVGFLGGNIRADGRLVVS
jgi:hypothetical protein